MKTTRVEVPTAEGALVIAQFAATTVDRAVIVGGVPYVIELSKMLTELEPVNLARFVRRIDEISG